MTKMKLAGGILRTRSEGTVSAVRPARSCSMLCDCFIVARAIGVYFARWHQLAVRMKKLSQVLSLKLALPG